MKQVKEWFGGLPLAALTVGTLLALFLVYIRKVFTGENALSELGGLMRSPEEKHWSDGIYETMVEREAVEDPEEVTFA